MRAILQAINERDEAAADPGECWGVSATAAAVAMYCRAEQSGEATPETLAPLSRLARASAAEARRLAENDPASPNLEKQCRCHLFELNMLITVFAHGKCKEYTLLCDAQKALQDATFGGVALVWQLVRPQAAQSKPPAILKKSPEDNSEYYTLKKLKPGALSRSNAGPRKGTFFC